MTEARPLLYESPRRRAKNLTSKKLIGSGRTVLNGLQLVTQKLYSPSIDSPYAGKGV